jgi:hypothetical protein
VSQFDSGLDETARVISTEVAGRVSVTSRNSGSGAAYRKRSRKPLGSAAAAATKALQVVFTALMGLRLAADPRELTVDTETLTRSLAGLPVTW